MAQGRDSADLFPAFFLSVYRGFRRCEVYSRSAGGRREGGMDWVYGGSVRIVRFYHCIRPVFLRICLRVWKSGGFCSWSVLPDLQKVQEKAAEIKREMVRRPVVSEILCSGSDCCTVFSGGLPKASGQQPLGCVFHDPGREFPARRVSSRTCHIVVDFGGHVCAGTVFLPLLMSHGGSVFHAASAAGIFPE